MAKDAGVAEIGMDLHIDRNATLGLTYGGQFSHAALDQSLRGDIMVRF